MDVLTTPFLTGTATGAILLMAALGLTLTFGQMGVINMANGEFLMVGAYVAYVTQQVIGAAGLSIVIALPIAFIVAGLLGLILEATVIQWMYERPLDTLLATVGVALVLQQLAQDVFGAQGDPVTAPSWMAGRISVFGYEWPHRQLFTIILAVGTFAALSAFLKYSSFGRRIRATVQNRQLAETLGVSTRSVDRITFFLGSGLAGLGGVAVALISGTNPTLGTAYIIPAFLVVVMGGIGQLKGTVIAAWAVGVVTAFLTDWTSGSMAQVITFAIVVVFLVIRPQGLFHRSDEVTGMTLTTTESPEASDGLDEQDATNVVPARTSSSAAQRLSTFGPLIGIAVLAVMLLVWAPSVLSTFRLSNLGRYCALALASMGIGLAWGRGGMLTMGQGVFFGLGAYAMAMHMKLEAAGPGGVPDFMTLYGDGTMPSWWEPFRSGPFTLFAIVALPAVVSFVLGFAILKRRVKGAYFAILTQAMAVAFATLLVATIKQTGGFNGLNSFSTVFGHNLYDPTVQKNIYRVAAGLVIVFLVILWQVYRSRFGELLVATRDAEERIRFLGYDPANIKLVAFMVASVMASVGGAMFVPIAGIISPTNVDAAASIFLLAGVALGGRASLFGPALGAIAVGYGRSTLSENFPTQWTYFLGALFIVVVVLLPGGVASLWSRTKLWWSSSDKQVPASTDAGHVSDPNHDPNPATPAVAT